MKQTIPDKGDAVRSLRLERRYVPSDPITFGVPVEVAYFLKTNLGESSEEFKLANEVYKLLYAFLTKTPHPVTSLGITELELKAFLKENDAKLNTVKIITDEQAILVFKYILRMIQERVDFEKQAASFGISRVSLYELTPSGLERLRKYMSRFRKLDDFLKKNAGKLGDDKLEDKDMALISAAKGLIRTDISNLGQRMDTRDEDERPVIISALAIIRKYNNKHINKQEG